MRKAIGNLRGLNVCGGIELKWQKNAAFSLNEGESQRGPYSEFTILRKECPNFEFGKDYSEFFLNDDFREAKKIFKGKITPIKDAYFSYVDFDVSFQTTYAYYIQPLNFPIVGPIPICRRDSFVWWSNHEINSRIEKLAEEYSDVVKVWTAGYTVRGNKIKAIRIGNAGPVVGLVGLIHAGESGPELIIPSIESLLLKYKSLFKKVSIIAMPAINIDEREKLVNGVPWYLRTNSAGVDLNRNFPSGWTTPCYDYNMDSRDESCVIYRGYKPMSEPETKACMKVFKANPPSVVFSYHALSSLCELPGLISKEADDKYFDLSCEILTDFAGGMYPNKAFKENWLQRGCSGGSLPVWIQQVFNVPAFDLEAGVTRKYFKELCIDKVSRKTLLKFQRMHTNAILKVLKYFLDKN